MKTNRLQSMEYSLHTLCAASLLAGCLTLGSAAEYEWNFSGGNLAPALGNGTMDYADASTPGVTSFGVTDGATVPNINGQSAAYMRVPALADPAQGYTLVFPDSGPNGGGAYINQYTLIMDLLSPGSLDWTALFNTNPDNGNDADFYIDPTGALGIGALGYSAPGTISSDTWYRIAFAADLGAGNVTYYVDGDPVLERTGGSLLDGRFSLYSNADPVPASDLLLFNEGDGSGVYTHELLVSSVYMTDRTMSAQEILALGGPSAVGILVPEPGVFGLLGLGLALCCGLRAVRRRRS